MGQSQDWASHYSKACTALVNTAGSLAFRAIAIARARPRPILAAFRLFRRLRLEQQSLESITLRRAQCAQIHRERRWRVLHYPQVLVAMIGESRAYNEPIEVSVEIA